MPLSDQLSTGERNLLDAAQAGKHITVMEVAFLTGRIEALRRKLTQTSVEAGRLEEANDELAKALKKVRVIAAREWAADETNYEWYGDIAGIAEKALGIDIWADRPAFEQVDEVRPSEPVKSTTDTQEGNDG